MNWSLREIVQVVGSNSIVSELEVTQISIDSRNVNLGGNTLFVAIVGERNDGHKYISELYQKGVRSFLVNNEGYKETFPLANFISCENTLVALQCIAASFRDKFNIPIIGITGSNGKTIVKEWLHTCLRSNLNITRSPKSYNSQVGVPLSVLQLNEISELGVFEAGISLPGEMVNLQAIIKPTIGVLTTIGAAHDEGFVSKKEKLKEKLLLFSNSEVFIYCSDHKFIDDAFAQLPNALSWGKNGKIKILLGEEGTLSINYKNKKGTLELPLKGDVHIENASHVIAVMLYLGYGLIEIQERINLLQPVKMRLSLLSGNYDSLIIDDSYSNDLPALDLALNFLKKHQQGKDATVVLSDVLESGVAESELYEEVSQLVNSIEPSKVLLVGDVIKKYKELFKGNVYVFNSTEELKNEFPFSQFKGNIILFKGARRYHFERLVKKLSSKVHDTTLEINLDHIVQNLNYFKSILRPTTKIMAMVKAYAYGSGYLEIANALQYHKVDYLAVAYVDEGIDLREKGINTPILVLNVEPENFDKLIQYNIEPEVFRLDQLLQYDQLATEPLSVHLKIDTGMHRLGFDLKSISELIDELKKTKYIIVKSVFTHLSSVDDPLEDDFTKGQITSFNKVSESIEAALGYPVLKHILNSAGIQRFVEDQEDMVRLGIGLYGIGVEPEHQEYLHEVGILKSKISQVRIVEKGESIGYNRGLKASEDMQIATVAIGYADGYDRRFSNGVGKIFIGGELRSVVGSVCMDMIMVDASGLNVSVGDEVGVLGGHISWAEAAKSIGTISYELLTGVGERVRRIFHEGDLI